MPIVELPNGAEAKREISMELHAAGIPGIKYLDGNSRGTGEGTRNFVVFDENDLSILTRNGESVGDVRVDTIERDGILEISKIETPPHLRGQGLAEAKLNQILADADAKGLKVALTPSGDFGASKSRLTKWYKKHGFKPNKGKNRDFMTRESLIRDEYVTK